MKFLLASEISLGKKIFSALILLSVTFWQELVWKIFCPVTLSKITHICILKNIGTTLDDPNQSHKQLSDRKKNWLRISGILHCSFWYRWKFFLILSLVKSLILATVSYKSECVLWKTGDWKMKFTVTTAPCGAQSKQQ